MLIESPEIAELSRAGWAARNTFWRAIKRRNRPTQDSVAESAYAIGEARQYLDWAAIDADEAKYWTSLAVLAQAARQLTALWAAPAAGSVGPGPARIAERDLFGRLAMALLEDSAAAEVCNELQNLCDLPLGGSERHLAADCLDVAPPTTAPPARSIIDMATARRLAQIAERVR